MELKLGDKLYHAVYGECTLVAIGNKVLTGVSLPSGTPQGHNKYAFQATKYGIIYANEELKQHPENFGKCFFTRDEARMLGMTLPSKTVQLRQAIVDIGTGVILSKELFNNLDEAKKEFERDGSGYKVLGLNDVPITYKVQEKL